MDTVAEIKDLIDSAREDRQIERELSIIENRVNTTFESIRDVASFGGQSVLFTVAEDMLNRAREAQSDIVNGDASMNTARYRILALEPEQLVSLVYKVIMDLAAKELDGTTDFSAPAHTIYRRLGSIMEVTARMNMMKYVKKGERLPQNNLPLVKLARQYNVKPEYLKRWRGKQLPACMKDTKDVDVILSGKLVWEMFAETLGGIMYCRKVNTKGNQMQYRIGILEDVVAIMETEAIDRTIMDAPLGFMVCEPNPLTATSVDARGRYLSGLAKPQKAMRIKVSEQTLRAANATQNTPYAINQTVFQLFMTLSTEVCDKLAGVADLPTEPNDGESVRQFDARCANVELSNLSKRRIIDKLRAAATEAIGYDQIWFPVYLDFRARQYSVDYKGLGPQSNKSAKALLQLANGSPLGSTGLWWLYHELGNSMGWDKDLLEEKVAKAKALLPRMRGIVANPMSDTVWLEGDDPLKVYACMVDIIAAIDSGKPEEFVSHLICYVDGSCNGMQHLSLMTRDKVGAVATNVICEDGTRSDFYSVVGNRMLDALEDDYSEAAMYWKTTACEKFGMRKIAKRGVMTIPYGATHAGLANQFIEDGFCTTKERSHKQTLAESFVIRDALETAMAGAAPKAMELRQWMLQAISAVCANGVSPEWTTPTGTRVIHDYLAYNMKRVRIGDFMTTLPDFSGKGAKVDAKKNRSSIVANLIHSFDAAMLQDTATRMLDQDIDDLSFVHDSYGASAAHMSTLSATLRQSAYDIYSAEQLTELHADFSRQAGKDIELPPALGDLDAADLLSAPYFFA